MARTQAKDYHDKRAALLKTSARLFADEGFERTSMAQVAKASGVSKALLYHYYSGKDELLFDIITGHLTSLIGVTEQAAIEPGPAEHRLHRMVVALLEEYRDADDEHRVQLSSLGSLPVNQQRTVLELSRKIVDLFAEAMISVVPSLKDRPELVKPVTMSLFGMLNWHYTWFREDGEMGREDYARLATRIIVEGTRNLDAASPQLYLVEPQQA
ncbi:MAG: TetR/AcrR family transcriptional regulator [Pseudomonadota bacterium]